MNDSFPSFITIGNKAKHMSKTMSFFMEIYENDLINLAMRKMLKLNELEVFINKFFSCNNSKWQFFHYSRTS